MDIQARTHFKPFRDEPLIFALSTLPNFRRAVCGFEPFVSAVIAERSGSEYAKSTALQLIRRLRQSEVQGCPDSPSSYDSRDSFLQPGSRTAIDPGHYAQLWLLVINRLESLGDLFEKFSFRVSFPPANGKSVISAPIASGVL